MINRSSLIIVIIFLTFSCARISTPTGGAEDKEPPVLQSSNPADGETNFSNKTIRLTFDEYVIAKSIETNLIITPSIDGSFKTKIKRNAIELTFDSTWQKNTTYSFNFGSTIQDLNEGNIPANLYLSFSTGATIDSLTLSGTITSLYSSAPIMDALVSLYTSDDTLNITSGPALYYTKTDSVGMYQFKNLPNTNFLVYAVLDRNNNLIADTDKELYGFLPDTVSLRNNQQNKSFTLQRLNTDPLTIKSGRHFGKYFDINFSKPILTYTIEGSSNVIIGQQLEDDRLRFYNQSLVIGDTTVIRINATDSVGLTMSETVKVYFNESSIEPDDFTIDITTNDTNIQNILTLTAAFSKPVKRINIQNIELLKDSTVILSLSDTSTLWNQDRTEAIWQVPLSTLIKTDEKINIKFERGAFISIESDSSQVINKPYQRLKAEDSGLIQGSINTNALVFLVQLLNNQNEVISQLENKKQFRFKNLNAGNYKVRLIIDKNQNGKLDVGNITTRTAPEVVIFFIDPISQSKTIGVKKNWEVDGINITYNVNNGN